MPESEKRMLRGRVDQPSNEATLLSPPIRKISSLPVAHLAEKLGLESVKRDPMDKFLSNPSLASLGFIPKREQTREIVGLAIEGERRALERDGFRFPELKNASARALDRDLCLAACSIAGANIRFVPKRFLDYEMYMAAVMENPDCIGAVPDRFIDEAILVAAVKNDRHPGSRALEKVLKHADKIKNVSQICRQAVFADPMAIDQVPKQYQTKELCREAVEREPKALFHVPFRYRTEELCRIAVSGDPLALQYVPENIITEDLAEAAVKSTKAVPGEACDWPIRYVPRKYLNSHLFRGQNRLVALSLEIDPYSAAAIPDGFLNVSTVKKIIGDHPDIYGKLSESIRSRKSLAALAVRLDRSNERYLPDRLRRKFSAKNLQAPVCQKPRVSETTRKVEKSEESQRRIEENGLGIVHESLDSDRRRRYIHYISDIHIDHQLKLVGIPYAEVVRRIKKKTDWLVSSRRDDDLFLLAGDIAPSANGLGAFLDAYRLSLGEGGRMGTMLCVLGNHELWSGQVPGSKSQFDLSSAIDEYRSVCWKRGVALLKNDLYIEYGSKGLRHIIDEETLLSAEDDDLGLLLRNCRLAVLGGCGFSGIGNGIKVDLLTGGIGDIDRSERFRRLHDKLLRCAGDQRIVILTHYPMKEWSTESGNSTWVYVNGHTHRNIFLESAAAPTVLADGQIGYRPSKWGYRVYALDTTGCCDPLSQVGDGIYEIDARLYEDFNRARGIEMSKFNRTGKIFALKRGGTYMFIHRGDEGGNLHLLSGGRITNLTHGVIEYYYRNLAEYSNRVESLFAPYYSALTAISEEVKSIGGYGYVHGSIIDIDYFNHIYLDPMDGSLVPYYAESTEGRMVFDSIERLLENSPFIDGNIEARYLKARKQGALSLIVGEKIEYTSNAALAPVLSTNKDMYKKSNTMKSIQYLLERNVVRIWNDRVLESNGPSHLDGGPHGKTRGLMK